MCKISLIIPVYNEEESLPKVLKDIPEGLVDDIIVVNNNSTDQTALVAREHGARVIFEAQRGYGKACLTGISALNEDTAIVIFCDGDYSDHPDQMGTLIAPIERNEVDFVIGSRALGVQEKGAMTPQATYGNILACLLMKLFWKFKYTDLGPFRAISYSALKNLKMCDEDFGWTIEMQIKAIEHGLRIKEVPVDYRKRVGESKISGTVKGTFLAGEKILRTIFKYKFLKNC